MVSVTILGAGVTGMTIASQLPADWKITIVAKHHVGDPEDMNFQSHWAGACWVGVPISSPRDQKMQLDAYAGLWKLARDCPDAGLRISDLTEIMEHGSPDAIWWQGKIPGFRFLGPSELPPRATWGMTYKSIIVSPPVFLKWLKARLLARGVEFQRREIQGLDELKGMGHDILINASGLGSRYLTGVSEKHLTSYRMQSIVMDKKWDKGFIYRGRDDYYFNIFGRPDNTCYVGGFKQLGLTDQTVYSDQRQEILDRGHNVLPEVMHSDKPSDYKILYDIATPYWFRPQEHGGARVEKEKINGQNVVHAYGQEAGGYSYSFGMARAAAALAVEYAYELPVSSHL